MSETNEVHAVTEKLIVNGPPIPLNDELAEVRVEVRSTCSCGAVWTHPKGRARGERLAIEHAHRTYGQRVKSVVL